MTKSVYIISQFQKNKDENVHKYAVRGEKDSEREREVNKGFCKENNQSSMRHKDDTLSITPKYKTYRDTAYLKKN